MKLAANCKSFVLPLLLCMLFCLGAPILVCAQGSMVRNCSEIEGCRLVLPQVAAGQHHSLALRQDGQLWGWGDNICGQVGNGGGTVGSVQTTPALIADKGFLDIAAGYEHTLALKNDGTVWGWGANDEGQLGGVGPGNHSVPKQIPNLSGVVAVDCGEYFSMALKNDGAVWAWGKNDYNQLGTGNPALVSRLPQQVKGTGGSGYLNNVKAIACGSVHSLALINDGTVRAWGAGSWGNLGNGEDFSESIYPVRVSNLTGVKGIDAGRYFSLALRNDGTVWAWGSRNWVGCLGDGGLEGYVATPQLVRNLSRIVAVACGTEHSLALKDDGRILAWGGNYGRLGDGSNIDRAIPVLTSGLYTGVIAVAAGEQHSLAWKDDDTVWAWGSNHHHQLGGEYSSQVPEPVKDIPQLARALTGLSIKEVSNRDELLTCFTPEATGYNLTLENPVERVKITPVPVSGATAVVKLNGVSRPDGIVDLAVDPSLNKVEVVVSEIGKDDLIYTVNIKRLRLADPLIGLSVKGGADGSGSEYMTGFNGNISNYKAKPVENAVGTVKVTPTASPGTSAVVRLNGVIRSGGVVNLATGWNNTVTVEVSQPDRSKRTYTVKIGRAPDWREGFANWPVGTDKSWVIQFSRPVNTTTATGNIYVTNAGGNRVPVELIWSQDKKEVTVKPQQDYTSGVVYTLHVDTELKSALGTLLNEAVSMPFAI